MAIELSWGSHEPWVGSVAVPCWRKHLAGEGGGPPHPKPLP